MPFPRPQNEGQVKRDAARGPCARLPRVRIRGGLALTLIVLSFAPGCRRPALPEQPSADRDTVAGRRIFERKCASCHNNNGDGRTIVAGHFPYANLIDGNWRTDGSAAAIESQIRLGHDPMPKFEGKLTEEEIRQTVAYVETMTRQPRPAGAAEGRAGP
jgi:mono/diheme cytochrome c family protein